MTDGTTTTGTPVSILTGQSTISSVSALEHVAYSSAEPDNQEIDYLYVFGTDAAGNKYFGVALVPSTKSAQDEVAAALSSLQVRCVKFRRLKWLAKDILWLGHLWFSSVSSVIFGAIFSCLTLECRALCGDLGLFIGSSTVNTLDQHKNEA